MIAHTNQDTRQELPIYLIEQARSTPIETITGRPPLKHAHNEYAGPCPLCRSGKDKFHINTKVNRWFCASCTNRRWDDPISFVMHRENMTFVEAVLSLTNTDKLIYLTWQGQDNVISIPTQDVEPELKWWQKQDGAASRLLQDFLEHPKRVELWKSHKSKWPLSDATIDKYKLGVGRQPSVPCDHDRLIMPVFENGEIVNFRGRSIDCDCAKWMTSAKGARFYMVEEVKEGDIVWIVENMVDALLFNEMYAQEFTRAVGLTHGASAWHRPLKTLIDRRPQMVMVGLDNDDAGRENADRIVKAVRELGVPAQSFVFPRWAKPKASPVDHFIDQRLKRNTAR